MYWTYTIHIVLADDDSKDKDQTTEDVGTESNPVLSQATPVPSGKYARISM